MQVSGVARVAITPDGKAIMEVAGRPAFQLNPVALSIWTKLSAGHSLREISSEIAAEFGAPEEVTAKDVHRFVKQLKEHLLVYDDA
ncbi:MAG: hypothetical protein DMG39_05865 [Acidobacteria bacterium]|nr:MAG: hypothetical protein DMG39_05865 [Acidobacteriota bacterium]